MSGNQPRKMLVDRPVQDLNRQVASYPAQVPKGYRTALEQLRAAVLSVVPDAEEVIRRGVPAFRYHSKRLVSIGAARDRVSLFVMYGEVLKAHLAERGCV